MTEKKPKLNRFPLSYRVNLTFSNVQDRVMVCYYFMVVYITGLINS